MKKRITKNLSSIQITKRFLKDLKKRFKLTYKEDKFAKYIHKENMYEIEIDGARKVLIYIRVASNTKQN